MLLTAFEGAEYVPPSCVTPMFSDVPCGERFARWVNELARRGITGGCGEGRFCPGAPVTRAQMALLVTRTFGLELCGQRQASEIDGHRPRVTPAAPTTATR
jgi:hypothetical protein